MFSSHVGFVVSCCVFLPLFLCFFVVCVFFLLFAQTRDEFDTLIAPMGLDKTDKAAAAPGSEEPSRFMDVSKRCRGLVLIDGGDGDYGGDDDDDSSIHYKLP